MPIDRYFRTRRVPMSWAAYEALPRHPAYKVEHVEGVTWLTPRDVCVHAVLALDDTAPDPTAPARSNAAASRSRRAGPAAPQAGVRIRSLAPEDWEPLARSFVASLRNVPPFETLEPAQADAALRECLEATRRGEDGPLVDAACFVAEGGRTGTEPCGGLLTTLLPDGDLAAPEAWRGWKEAPPRDCVERRMGRPHLTWVFVDPFEGRQGIAGALLGAAVAALRALGYVELASTTLSGNVPSILWHWQRGFRMLPDPWRRGVQY